MRIRPYRATDYSVIKEWITSEEMHEMWCGGRLTYGFSAEEFAGWLKANEDNYNSCAFTAIVSGGKPVGFFCLSIKEESNSGFMSTIIVDAKERGKGYGSRMVSLAIQYVFEILNLEAVELLVFEQNTAARKAYEKVGLKEVEYIPDSYTYKDTAWGRYRLRAEKNFFEEKELL